MSSSIPETVRWSRRRREVIRQLRFPKLERKKKDDVWLEHHGYGDLVHGINADYAECSRGVTIHSSEWFDRPDFQAFLSYISDGLVAGWTSGDDPSTCTDVFTLYHDNGDGPNSPEHVRADCPAIIPDDIWLEIKAIVSELGISHAFIHIVDSRA
jgi:hypothetical protein